jgi:hypothetical protein
VGSMAITFMQSLTEAWESAAALVDTSASLALAGLEDGGDLQGLYPGELYYGNRGVLDDFRADLLAAGRKVVDKAVKRLAKTDKLAGKEAGLALSFVLAFPSSSEGRVVNPNEATGFAHEPRLDVLVACSALDVAGDGVLVASGLTDLTPAVVPVGYIGPDGVSDSDDFVPDGDGRFVAVFSAPSLPEGGYGVWVDQGVGVFDDALGLGIR